jgi:hypothetical protein
MYTDTHSKHEGPDYLAFCENGFWTFTVYHPTTRIVGDWAMVRNPEYAP